MTDFEEQERGNLRQRFVRIRPVPFEGTEMLAHRSGGVEPLPVKETQEGVFLSSWMIDSDICRKFMREMRNGGRKAALSLVVDTNVPGHPTVSMQLQGIFITKD